MAVRFPEKEGVRYHDGGQVFGPEIEVMRKVDAPTFDVRRIETDGRQEGPPMFLNCPSPPAAVPFADDGVKNEDFDIVITDIKMPIMTGIELAGWIYQNKPDTKVIIVSGYSDFEYARKALEYKVFDYLLKPISKDKVSELTQRIKSEIAEKNKMFAKNNTIVILACAGAYLLYGSEVLLPGERFWTDSGIDTFMDNLLTTSEEYIFFNRS